MWLQLEHTGNISQSSDIMSWDRKITDRILHLVSGSCKLSETSLIFRSGPVVEWLKSVKQRTPNQSMHQGSFPTTP